MTKRLAIDDGLVRCPFRGQVRSEECTTCPNGRGLEMHRGHQVAVCRAASRWFPNEHLSGW